MKDILSQGSKPVVYYMDTGASVPDQALVSDQAASRLAPTGFDPSRKGKSYYEHDGVVLQNGHVDPITGPRCFIRMQEGPYKGLYVIGHTHDVLAEGTPVWRNLITHKARPRDSDGNPKGGNEVPSRSDDSAGRKASPESHSEAP